MQFQSFILLGYAILGYLSFLLFPMLAHSISLILISGKGKVKVMKYAKTVDSKGCSEKGHLSKPQNSAGILHVKISWTRLARIFKHESLKQMQYFCRSNRHLRHFKALNGNFVFELGGDNVNMIVISRHHGNERPLNTSSVECF